MIYLSIQKKRGEGIFNFYKSYLKKGGKMLDYGCASGGTMIPWIKNGWNAYGLDPHTPSVNFGNKMLGLKIKNCFGEKIKYNFNQDNFSKLISKKSKTQIINIKNQIELKSYFKKNILEDEMIICMGAGSISNWIREIGDELK